MDDTIKAGVMSVMSVPAGQGPESPCPGSCPRLASSGWDCRLQSRQIQRGVRTHSAGIHQVMTYRAVWAERLAVLEATSALGTRALPHGRRRTRHESAAASFITIHVNEV